MRFSRTHSSEPVALNRLFWAVERDRSWVGLPRRPQAHPWPASLQASRRAASHTAWHRLALKPWAVPRRGEKKGCRRGLPGQTTVGWPVTTAWTSHPHTPGPLRLSSPSCGPPHPLWAYEQLQHAPVTEGEAQTICPCQSTPPRVGPLSPPFQSFLLAARRGPSTEVVLADFPPALAPPGPRTQPLCLTACRDLRNLPHLEGTPLP